jgi:hypothetical protein
LFARAFILLCATLGRGARATEPRLSGRARERSRERSRTAGGTALPEKRIVEKARKDKRAGKAPSTQAGEFVHEEIRKIRRGERGARSPEQAIAIGLFEARRAGVALRPPKKGRVKESTGRSAEYAYVAGQHKRKTHRRPRVARAVKRVIEHEPRSTASRAALSRHARRAAAHRTNLRPFRRRA